jgi:glycosyltransferase involved in cell wall biosynthesis
MATNAVRSGRVAMLAHTNYLRDPRVRRQAEALAEAGVEVHVIALSERAGSGGFEPRHAVVKGVELHRLPVARKRGSHLRYLLEYFATGVLGALALTRLRLRGRLDVVHVHNMPDLLVFAAVIPWLFGSKVILDVHDPMPELYQSWDQGAANRLLVALLGLQEKLSCAFADRVISVNDTMRENLRAKGVADEKILIVNNFPDQRLFPVCDPSTAWPRSRDGLVLLYCGTVTEHYDLALAVRAIARLAGEIPVKLRILGEGNRLTEVLNLASQLGVRDSIEHLGVVPIEKVRAELKQADIGISCHRAGVFGDLYFSTKIVEYLTQGLPVLSPRTKTICRYLPDDCMFYFEPGNDAALADCLRFVWRNPAEVTRRLAHASAVLPRLSWQAEKDKLVSFYADLLAGHRAVRAGVVRSR